MRLNPAFLFYITDISTGQNKHTGPCDFIDSISLTAAIEENL